MTNLRNCVAVVTGASRGIGRATAIALAEAGAHVVCTARSTTASPSRLPGTIEETAEQVRRRGVRALAVRCDLACEAEIEALVESTVREFGRVDLLVNNAAVNAASRFADTSAKRWDLVFDVNVRGAFLCAKHLLPHLQRAEGASIVNVSSGMSVLPEMAAQLGMIAYGASKAALDAMTQSLAAELRPLGISVNGLRIEVAVATEGAVFFNPDLDVSDWEKPEGSAAAILWLATRDASFTGQVLTLAEVRREMARAG